MVAALESLDVILIVIGAAIILFGGAKIPKIARSLGSAKVEFEKGLKEGQTTAQGSAPPPAQSPAAAGDDPRSTDAPGS